VSERRRLFLTGSERAEFEHIHGPLTVDTTDPRFVLVDEETEAKIAALPPGVPVRQGQHPRDLAAIRAAELEAWGVDEGGSDEASEIQGGKGSVKAEALDVDTEAERGEADGGESGKGKTNTRTAASGAPADGSPVKPAARGKKTK
jgi:hypothetical protein